VVVSRAEGAVPAKESIDRPVAHSLKTRCRTTVCSLMYDTGVRFAPRSDAAGAFFLAPNILPLNWRIFPGHTIQPFGCSRFPLQAEMLTVDEQIGFAACCAGSATNKGAVHQV
jgi:hypothetical protein